MPNQRMNQADFQRLMQTTTSAVLKGEKDILIAVEWLHEIVENLREHRELEDKFREVMHETLTADTSSSNLTLIVRLKNYGERKIVGTQQAFDKHDSVGHVLNWIARARKEIGLAPR